MTIISAPNKDIRLFIVVRNDLESMNTGKLAAQACHCASMAATHAFTPLYQEWAQFNGVGTAIVLQPRLKSWFEEITVELDNKSRTINADYGLAKKDPVVLFDRWVDPTYPLRDGSVTHYINLHTCTWFMLDVNDSRVSSILDYQKEKCRLHP